MCPTLCDPIDSSPPGSPVPGILQARILEWVVSDSERPHGLQPTGLLHPWDFPGKSTGVGCHCLLQISAYWESNKRNRPLEVQNFTTESFFSVLCRPWGSWDFCFTQNVLYILSSKLQGLDRSDGTLSKKKKKREEVKVHCWLIFESSSCQHQVLFTVITIINMYILPSVSGTISKHFISFI